ncbi:Ig-like domain-containing protein [Galbibacter sp. EGI 63066]|uniref:Ig-like domain-containing protein n=1 Tax=Galbibacter sp. EGI 63066 TaxID=2993559 RepID=UPI0022491CF8|nr:Ig-like domain-containing protein [Galbibacter sp. EGI 63066]MCX2679307.1 Ig-like domain-containing protein [Galbibacter sp. EGI 63066]
MKTPKQTLLKTALSLFVLISSLQITQAQITNAPANTPSPWISSTYPNVTATLIDDVPSALPLCLGSAGDQANLVDADLTNAAFINFVLGLGVGAGCNATFSVSDDTNTYPAGTWAGFRIGGSSLLDISVGLSITISTWNDGNPTGDELVLDTALINVGLLSDGSATVGFVAPSAFDEVRIEYETLVAAAYDAEIYHATIIAFEAGPALACNTTTPMTRPAYPMSVSDENSDLSNILTINGNSDTQNVVDSDPDNFTTLDFTLGTGSLAIRDEVSSYSAGTFAGFDIESTSLLSTELLDEITITTYLDGTQQESISGSSNGILALNTSILNSGNERTQIGIITTAEFDEVQITGGGLLGSIDVYGLTLKSFCPADASVLTCNTPVLATEPDFPLYINGINTGISGIGVGDITNVNAVIDADDTNFATIDMAVGIIGSASLAIADPLDTYPADTYAGFDISTGGLLSVELLDNVTLTTYLDGVEQETVDVSTDELLAVDSGLLFADDGRYQIGFVASLPFDEVQITINQLAGVDIGVTNIYGVILETLCEAPIVCDIAPLTNPSQPVILNSEFTGIMGVAGVETSLSNAENVLTEDETDFATATLGIGVAEVASVAVKNALGVYPAGSQAGFLIRDANDVLQAGLLDVVTISTYLNGTEVDSNTGSGLLLIETLDLLDIEITGDPERYQFAGVITTGDYDEVRIEIGALASVLNIVEVYGAYVNPRTIEGLENNPTITITSVAEDNVVNAQEAEGNVNIVGQAGGDALPGDAISVMVNGTAYNTTVESDNSFTISVPGSELIADSDLTVEATITHITAECTSTAEDTHEYTIDTTPPTIPTVDELTTNDPTPVLTGTADSADDLSVTVNGVTYNEGDGNLVDNGDGTWTLQIPDGNEIPDGVYDVTAIATDEAGNTANDETTDELTIDTSLPTTPTVDEMVTNDPTPILTGTADSEDELSVTVNGVTYTEGDGNLIDNGDGTWTLQIPDGNEIPDGIYDVTAIATDEAGNTANDETTDELTIDTSLPTTPTVDELTTNDPTPIITGTADSEDDLTVEVNGVVYTEGDSNLIDNGDGTWTLQIPDGNEIPDGTYDVIATTADADGNTADDNTTDELTVDSTAITTPTVDELITDDPTPVITGTADSDDDLTVEVNGVVYTEGDGNLVDNGDGTWSLTIPEENALDDGTYDVIATATGTNGNTANDDTTNELTIDSTAGPTTPTVNEITTDSPTPTITGTVDSDDELTVEVNGVVYTEGDGNLVDNGDDTWSLTIPEENALDDGTYDVIATATDANGNTANDDTTDELTIESPPASDITITKTVDNTNPLVGDNIEFSITVSNNGNTEFTDIIVDERIQTGFSYVNHSASIGTYNPSNSTWTINELVANETATLNIRVEVNPTGSHTNVASIRTSTPKDANDGNNSSEVTITLNCLVVYNEFTPNNDGYNDYFRIECIEQYPNSELRIFNRNGNKIYEVRGYQNDWTGTANMGGTVARDHQLPAGTYFYSLLVPELGVDKSGWLFIAK